jgi:hypothetical protein
MRIKIPLIGQFDIRFKSRKTLDLERLMEAFGKDNAIKFHNTQGPIGVAGKTGQIGPSGWLGISGTSGTLSWSKSTDTPQVVGVVSNFDNKTGIATVELNSPYYKNELPQVGYINELPGIV